MEQTTDTGTIQSETTSSTVNEESVSKEVNTNSEKAVDWETEDKGTYILLKRYTGSATDLVVPNEISGKPTKLLDIDENVIPNLQNLTSFIVKQNQNGQKVGLETTDLARAFSIKQNKIKTINLSGLDTSNVISMNSMFTNCDALTNLDLGDSFDTSNVTNMEVMFAGCVSLKELSLGNKFDTSQVTNMYAMFDLCTGLTSLNLGDKFNTSNVTNMEVMFAGCMSLKKLDLGNKFDTSQVTNMLEMFFLCTSLMSLNLGDKFNTSNAIKMDRMFSNCMSLKKIDLGEKFNVNKKNVSNLFYVPYSVPLLVITKDSQLLNSYNYSADNRVSTSKPYLNANGGFFEDSQPTKNYFTKVANTPEYCSLENVQNFLNKNKPTKENYRFKQWETNPKEPTNLEELLNTTYTATW
ncbi:MAG: BspA family leucine-rich repeat surface protein [Clostridiales bacterium]|nr:BspA family leucine-rich repeat surface protein [Clostridiales bacterium]